jgi:hypothetical protein
MIKQFFLVLTLTYMEYFIFWLCLEYKDETTWDNIKFWLKYPPFICLFFFLVDSWIVATMIYITFSYPYLLMIYCIKNVNREAFGYNKILININNTSTRTFDDIIKTKNNKKKKKWISY